MAFFEDQLADGSHSTSTLLDMLASIREYARFTKVRSLIPMITLTHRVPETPSCLHQISSITSSRLEW